MPSTIFHAALHRFACAALLSVAVFSSSSPAQAQDAMLEIAVGTSTQQLSQSALLKHPALRTIEVANDATYHRTMHYQALPLAALVPTLSQLASVQFTARDGFAANIPGALLAGSAQAWLAVEALKAPWPALKAGGPSAGPFYLVWLAPEKSGVSPEQWPYQIARIAQAAPLAQRYPQIVPVVSADSAAQRGLQVYATNCAACHSINGAGDAAIGPDLNRPFSPTEYFQEPYLRKLIRDPASVRNWGQRIMPGFAPSALSEAQLDDLLAYLRQMARQR